MSYLDTRDLEQKRLELEEAKEEWLEENEGEPFADEEELDELNRLKDEIGEWEYGETMIPEHMFEDYAQELAEDMGEINTDWPYNHIDWEAAAHELSFDYLLVEYQGENYYVRA